MNWWLIGVAVLVLVAVIFTLALMRVAADADRRLEEQRQNRPDSRRIGRVLNDRLDHDERRRP